jgi:adenylyltransferase/sulfurtransferase
VLDCSDNFTTRYALNRACISLKKPLVSGAAIKLTGQLFVVDPRQPNKPCYACLYPEDGLDEDLRCATGILAPVTGVIGACRPSKPSASPGSASLLPGCCNVDALTGRWTSAREQGSGCPCCQGQDL